MLGRGKEGALDGTCADTEAEAETEVAGDGGGGDVDADGALVEAW